MQANRFFKGFITLMLLGFGQWADAAPPAFLPPHVAGEVLVKYRPDRAVQQAVHYRTMWHMSHVTTFPKSGIRKVKLPADMTVEQAVEIYGSDPDVLYAEPNYRYRLQALPDDPRIDHVWGLRNVGQSVNGTNGTIDADMDADMAWELETGSRDIVVAIVDSGMDLDHPDLSANLWTNPEEIAGNGRDDDGNGYVDDVHGWDFADDDNLPSDSHGHGTHVAGIVGALGNDGQGIAGVCWRVSIMPLRFITAADYGTTASAIAAIAYADDQGADIINLSWGGTYYSQALKDAIEKTDALVVCAAGNEGRNLDQTPLYPASYDSANILSVAATDADDYPAWFTSYSANRVDVAAPGTDILSTIPDRQIFWADNFSTSDTWLFGGTDTQWAVETSAGGRRVLTESPGGRDYTDDMDVWAATAMPLDLSGQSGARLDFQVIGSTADPGDSLYVEVSTNQINWDRIRVGLEDEGPVKAITGTLPFWKWAVADIGAYDGQATVHIRFRFISDSAGTAEGYSIANLTFSLADTTHTVDNYQYYQGTSMSTAYASGAAALVMARTPSLVATQVKLVLETSVDHTPLLDGYVATAGRLNIHNALLSVAAVDLDTQAVAADGIALTWATEEALPTGFEIQRRATEDNDFVTIADTGANETDYRDIGLSANATYTYRILTLSGTTRTGYSNEAAATTLNSAGVDVAGSGEGGGGGGCFIGAAEQQLVCGQEKRTTGIGAPLLIFLLGGWLWRKRLVNRTDGVVCGTGRQRTGTTGG